MNYNKIGIKSLQAYIMVLIILTLAGCARKTAITDLELSQTDMVKSEEEQTMKMIVIVGSESFEATLEDNEAVHEFYQMMQNNPVTLSMSDYSGFEKVGSLGDSLTASDSDITTQAGDIVLYNGSQIVVFYGSNSWSYTKLGRIDDLTGWKEALGSGDVSVTFSVK